MKTKTRNEIKYIGTGFPVLLLNFPAYEDEGRCLPDVPLGRLHRAIAYCVITRQTFISGAELSFLRSQADLNRSEAARRLGITRRTLINWEERGDQQIKAPPISHPGIRLFFFSRIFPDGSIKAADMPAGLLNPAEPPIIMEHSWLEGFDGIIGGTNRIAS